MAHWDDTFHLLGRIREATNAENLGLVVNDIAEHFGGSGYSVSSFTNGGKTFRRGIDGNLNGFPEIYEREGLAQHCAVSRKLMTTKLPFTWDEVRESSRADRDAQDIFDIADSRGLQHGYYFPALPREWHQGFTFIRTLESSLPTERLPSLAMLAMAAEVQLESLDVRNRAREQQTLSWREVDILSWFAEGKSAQDIADLLDISLATVMFHYRKVADRYGTLNRTHTLVEALRRGDLLLH